VVAATSHKGDIGVYYSGLGAVTPLATVTVKSRVHGQLMSVRYREGDTVHQGDLLVEIDDGPYQAALTQAEGQLMRDQAARQTLEVDAYSRDATTKLAQGPLTTLDNEIDPTTGTLKLRATFDNAKGTLFPNQLVHAKLPVRKKRGATVSPTAAVRCNWLKTSSST
jgi:multidrug efflux system membrane fusion protein